MHRACRIVVTAAACVIELGCGATDESSTSQQRDIWSASAPEQFVVQTCTFGYNPEGCVRAVVSQNEVSATEGRIYTGMLSWESAEHVNPIEDMFNAVESGALGECNAVDVEYDTVYGFVRSYTCESTTFGREILCFEPDTVDITTCDATPR